MPNNRSADIELRALAVLEELLDSPDDQEHRESVLGAETVEVSRRVLALEARANSASNAMATVTPGERGDSDTDPPERVGAFDLKRRIGRGGMGDVWLAHRADGLYEQTVAIKLIQRRPRAVAAFNDERRFLAQLEHPNIARLIDGGVTDDGLPWLAMEFVNGRSIEDAAMVLALPGRLRLFIEAADAVQFAHSRMIAHGDIKPSNILVDDGERVKLLDFGVSRMIGGVGSPTPRLQPLTPEFASPQRREGAGPSVRDDVYALGKTLERIIQGAGDREIDAIAAKARSDSESERYSSVAELIADIERWQAIMPVTALPDTRRYRAAKFAERHHISLSAAAAAFLLLLTTSVIATFNYFVAERSRAQAELRFDEVRELARFLLFDQYDALARQPGAVALRAAIASEAAVYLDRLASSGGSRRSKGCLQRRILEIRRTPHRLLSARNGYCGR